MKTICKKCGCIYDDGRAECIDCGVFTRKATARELEDFEERLAKTEEMLSDASERENRRWENRSRPGDSVAQSVIQTAVKLLLP